MFNDLIAQLEEQGFKVFAYADDLCVVQYKKNLLKKAIKINETWTIVNNMQINKQKLGILFFQKKGGRIDEEMKLLF